MLSRLVRIQLVLFAIASVVGTLLMAVNYMQVPTLLGIGKITVTLDLPAGGGLYRFSNVTFRGVQVGTVTAVGLSSSGATATLSLDASPRIPSDLQAEVRSVSAIGEQYVDLLPRTDSAPYLVDGSVISARDTTIPQRVGPMLDSVSELIKSIPKGKLGDLLDESFKAFNGSGYDLGSLFDSSNKITSDLNPVSQRMRTLADDSVPLLDSQVESGDAIRTWARSLSGVTEQVVQDDGHVRTLLEKGPGFMQESARLLAQIKPTLPVLLANLTSLGQVLVTYNASLEQLLVLLPPWVASLQSASPDRNYTGLTLGDFKFSIADPESCTVGYLPPTQWRSPADTTTIDAPDGMYCKLPQDSPIGVRGARNYPCMGHPGKRAPTVEICDSDKPFEPVAMRQHILGPSPVDPNLISQGIPPDDRVNPGENLYGPLEGTPMPPGLAPPPGGGPPPGTGSASSPTDGAAPPPADGAPPAAPDPAVPGGEGVPVIAPSAFGTNTSGHTPSVAVAQYDPGSGKYMDTDGTVRRQLNVVSQASTWKDLVLNTAGVSG
jgi:virulence factor Mce-like protein